ncbi:sensor histidine kinase [Sphaerotilus mobilis]|uniref:histidine kinase n=1 Tax=Sphaerotilus mobilis TaxID=47994 RepID=A0A4Q7LRL1_9BURK|nr:HAMP domain-containing sensor histidine kinase [Sphaerotilus mobilis]RZS56767.1 signal transduction histidine kinase [Sphaerotilus mobilis]
MSRAAPASIATRITRAMAAWSVVWLLLVTLAVLMSVRHEVDELLDDAMLASSEVLTAMLSSPAARSLGGAVDGMSPPSFLPSETRYAWQLVNRDGRVDLRSNGAPESAWLATPTAGYTDLPDWHVHGAAVPATGQMLYVAQTQDERREALIDLALGAALATLCVALLAWFTLHAMVLRELAPLARLSQRLSELDPVRLERQLGPPERAELVPVHQALDLMGRRLARRLAQERVFSAHAAHALRTPLAGMDVQLAMAVREAPASLQTRLSRVREAGSRMQRMVATLLLLFRADGVDATALRLQTLDVAGLLARWPIEGLVLQVQPGLQVRADADLLAAALLNLIDNALRHGGHTVRVEAPQPDCLRISDDGPGVLPAQRQRLALWLARLDDDELGGPLAHREGGDAGPSFQAEGTGLGLQMAQLVARAHGGSLDLPDLGAGFVVDLHWPMAVPPSGGG